MLALFSAPAYFIHPYQDLDAAQKKALRNFFVEEVFPGAHPALPSTPPTRSRSSRTSRLTLRSPSATRKERGLFARIKVPHGLFPRLVRVLEPGTGSHRDDKQVHLVYLENLVAANLDLLFPGLEVVGASPFRITRDADLDIEVDEASDLLTTVEEIMEQRARGTPVRIEVDSLMHENTCHMLEKKLGIGSHMLYRIGHPVGVADLMELLSLDRPDLKDSPFQPSIPPELAEKKIFFLRSGKRISSSSTPMTVLPR